MPYGRPLFAPCSVECIGWSEERVAIISPLRAQQGEDCRYFRPTRRVVLDDLGSFVISIRSKCFPRETMQDKEFTPSSMIRGYHINFRPEVELKKDIAQGIGYKRISSDAMA